MRYARGADLDKTEEIKYRAVFPLNGVLSNVSRYFVRKWVAKLHRPDKYLNIAIHFD